MAEWYRFHVSCHARPATVRRAPPRDVAGHSYTPLDVRPDELNGPLAVGFEQACAVLDDLPRMFCEPDGSFVWRCHENPPGQVDGVLFDDGHRLLYVELHGHCPAAQFDRLLTAFGHERTPLVFQLTHEGLVLDESQFRLWAARSAGS